MDRGPSSNGPVDPEAALVPGGFHLVGLSWAVEGGRWLLSSISAASAASGSRRLQLPAGSRSGLRRGALERRLPPLMLLSCVGRAPNGMSVRSAVSPPEPPVLVLCKPEPCPRLARTNVVAVCYRGTPRTPQQSFWGSLPITLPGASPGCCWHPGDAGGSAAGPPTLLAEPARGGGGAASPGVTHAAQGRGLGGSAGPWTRLRNLWLLQAPRIPVQLSPRGSGQSILVAAAPRVTPSQPPSADERRLARGEVGGARPRGHFPSTCCFLPEQGTGRSGACGCLGGPGRAPSCDAG